MLYKQAVPIALLASLAIPSIASAQWDEDPKVAAQKAADQAMAKALAEKARNDAIVAEQRRREAEAKAKAQKPAKPASSDGSRATQQ